MRHLKGLLSVAQLLYGIRYHRIMFAISNFGYSFTKAQIGLVKEKIPPKKGDQNHY